jgi:hypothetical protein
VYTANKIAFNQPFSPTLKAADIYGIVTQYSDLHNNVQPSMTARYLLDVATGDFYQLPHLSVGVIEMAFSISTGHPDWIAVGIEEYGISGNYNGTTGGSRWNVWIGKKDKTSTNFLDRNGLAPNCGRVYVYVADDAQTDMATYLEWPASGNPSYNFSPKFGKLKPINGMFDGNYSNWFAARVNTLPTTDGSMPVHMTNRGKQEWGAVNPDQPNQWAIAETGLGGSAGGRSRGCSAKTAECPMGTSSSTVSFLQAEFANAFGSSSTVMTGNTRSRDSTVFPDYIDARVNGVLADQVYMGPHRSHGSSPSGLGQRGFAGVDSLLWLKGGNVLASEDSYGPGGFNMGIMYNVAQRKSVPIVGAISRYGITKGKMNSAAMAPYGSFSGATNQEMTGFYDASPALTVPVPFTPQQVYDAQDGKHVIVNNQMKGSSGPMHEGFYYSSQMHLLELPTIDWNTYPVSPHTLSGYDETHWTAAYGRFRRKMSEEEINDDSEDKPDVEDDWHLDHDDFNTDHH